MSQELEDARAARAGAYAKLRAAMTVQGSAGYAPNSSGGATVDHNGEVQKLLSVIAALDDRINDLEEDEDGVVIVDTHGIV